MTPRMRRDGDAYVKRVADPAAAGQIAAWTAALRGAGVPTPEARLDTATGALIFPVIEGTSGLASIVERGESALTELLRPLLALHRAAVPGLSPFDPAAKIYARLEPRDPAPLRDELRALLAALPAPASPGPVHGDFHAGQLVLDPAGRAWLLDLEDLAAGAPESDLGNFAAHLGTRPETRRGPVRDGFEHWLDHVLGAYSGIGGQAAAELARLHGRIALIRRALKLDRRGNSAVLMELWPRRRPDK
ncbi:MAG TPA: phosphotransferase [Thermohalobaculum sp.]|nr:phosphotransferase [Thermohalobaculum sp.]